MQATPEKASVHRCNPGRYGYPELIKVDMIISQGKYLALLRALDEYAQLSQVGEDLRDMVNYAASNDVNLPTL